MRENLLQNYRQILKPELDDYIAGCEAHGITPRKPYSGNINLRMKPEVHSKVAMVAEQLGTSINEYINQIIVNDLNNTIYNKQLFYNF